MNQNIREQLSAATDLDRVVKDYVLKPNTIQQARTEIGLLLIDRWNLWREVDLLKANKGLDPIEAAKLQARACTAEARTAQLHNKIDKVKEFLLQKEKDSKDCWDDYYDITAFNMLKDLLNIINE